MPSGSATIPTYTPVNIQGVQSLAQNTASQDIANSQALEAQYSPQIAASRPVYGQDILGALQALPGQQAQQQAEASGAVAAAQGAVPQVQNATLTASPIQGQVNSLVSQQLQNPGALPPDVYDYVTRQALSGAGGAGLLSGPGAGNLTLRQLGLNSLNQYNNTIATGNTIGQQQTALAQSQQQIANQTATTNANLQQAAQGLQAQTGLAASNRTLPGTAAMNQIFATPYPVSGLSPSDVAGLSVSNTNNQNAYSSQVAGIQTAQSNANAQATGQDIATAASIAALFI